MEEEIKIEYKNRKIIIHNNTDDTHEYEIRVNNKIIENGKLGGMDKEVKVIQRPNLYLSWEAKVDVLIDNEQSFTKIVNSKNY